MSGSDQDKMYQSVRAIAENVHEELFENHGDCFTVKGRDVAGDAEYVAVINEPRGITMLVPLQFTVEGAIEANPAIPNTRFWVVPNFRAVPDPLYPVYRIIARVDEGHVMLRFHSFTGKMEDLLIYLISFATQRNMSPPALGPEEATL